MAVEFNSDKQQLHELVDKLPPEQLSVALRYLNCLLDDPVTLSLLTAPPDDEPYTDGQRERDAEAEEAIARGEGIAHQEILREFGV